MEQTVKKRKQQAIETKEKIFEATMELIQERGIDNVQIEDISRKANVSMGLFYKYFANKSDVITEAINRKSDNYYLRIQEKYLNELRGEEKIRCFVKYVADYHGNTLNKEDLKHNYATILANPSRRESITKEERPIYSIIAEGIEEMIEDGEMAENVSVEMTARYITMLVRGTIFEYLLNDEEFDLDGMSSHLVITYLNGLKNCSDKIKTEQISFKKEKLKFCVKSVTVFRLFYYTTL